MGDRFLENLHSKHNLSGSASRIIRWLRGELFTVQLAGRILENKINFMDGSRVDSTRPLASRAFRAHFKEIVGDEIA